MFDIASKLFQRLNTTAYGCMEFTGALSDGYGTIKINGLVYRAHRLMWSYFNGPIPQDKIICHKCDNPSCCNIDHLFLGTKQDNSDDMIYKGRDNHDGVLIQGTYNGQAKLQEEDVYQIRKLLSEGYTQQEIADGFGVSRKCISKIKNGLTWSWLQ